KMLKILIGVGGVAVVGGGAAGAAIVLTKKNTDVNAGGNGEHGLQTPGTHNPIVRPQSISHHEILVSDIEDFKHKLSGTINAADVYKFPGSTKTFTGKEIKMLKSKSLSVANAADFINQVNHIKGDAYFYYDGSSITSDTLSERVESFKKFLFTKHQIIVPASIQITNVTKPNKGASIHPHDVTVTFTNSSSINETIRFDYNHEKSAQSAFLKNHFGWFKGAVANFVINHSHMKSFIERILSHFHVNHTFAHFIGEFMGLRMIVGALATGVSAILAPAGMSLILPLAPLYLISYFIKKGVKSKIAHFEEDIKSQLANYQIN
ncbi:MAG: hypothetical protein KAG14_02735, partial [Mycoplasmataceae bacterium]|nr:hypothetical protein [Mycoplasmataceae bacterium]